MGVLKRLWDCTFGINNPINNDPFFDKVEEYKSPNEGKPISDPPPPKGVSEPVISFAKMLREEPENFLWREKAIDKIFGYCRYTLIDRKNKRVFKYDVTQSFTYTDNFEKVIVERAKISSVRGVNFLTGEELLYLSPLHKKAVQESLDQNAKKREEEKNNQRQKYIDIYCKEK